MLTLFPVLICNPAHASGLEEVNAFKKIVGDQTVAEHPFHGYWKGRINGLDSSYELEISNDRIREHSLTPEIPFEDVTLLENGAMLPAKFMLDTGNEGCINVQHVPGQESWVTPDEKKYRYNPAGLKYGSGVAGVWDANVDFKVGPFF